MTLSKLEGHFSYWKAVHGQLVDKYSKYLHTTLIKRL